MDREQYSTENKSSHHQSLSGPSSANSMSGPASAWNIAFNDLKRRYLHSQNEVGTLKEDKGRTAIEVCKMHEQLDMFRKDNEQLNISLDTKESSYNKLEGLYNEQREFSQRNENYTKSLFSKVQKLGEERTFYETQLKNALDENKNLANLNDMLFKEKAQLEEELEAWKSVPEVTVKKETNENINSIDDKDKKVQNLISENKTLKTSLHWLSEELKKSKDKKCSSHAHNINGCLEEGINNFGLNANYPHDIKGMNLRTYIQMLHTTINHLKSALSSHLEVSKKIVNSQYPKSNGSSQNYTPYLFKKTEEEPYKITTEPRKVIQIYEQHERKNNIVSLKESNAEKKEEHKKQYPNLWRTHEATSANTNIDYDVLDRQGMNYQQQQLVQKPAIPSSQYITTLLQQSNNSNTPFLQTNNSIATSIDNSNQQTRRSGEILRSNLPPSLFHNVRQVQAQTFLTQSDTPPVSSSM